MARLLLRDATVGGERVDVAIGDGRIAAIAPSLETGGVEVVALDGRVVQRGLWDEHVHVTQAALAAVWTPLGGAASAAEALGRMAAADAGADPLIGIGYQDGLWPDRPTRAAIDTLAGERTVALISHDVHAIWLSSAAARRFGVRPGPDGIVREGPAFAVGRELNRLAAAQTDRAVVRLMERASRLGVVGVVDFEMTWNRDVWLERMADGWDGPRIEAGVYPSDLDRAVALGMRTGVPLADRLSVGPLKTLVDGALNTRTAYCVDAYPDGGHGVLTIPEADLTALLRRAGETGFLPAIHAIGDAAITVVLDSFATAGVRGRIEHAQLIADTDLSRFAQLGVVASVQPGHLLDDRGVAEEHWSGRTGRAYPFHALLAAGATLAFGSDAPVAPLDPWLAMRAAVDRAIPGEDPWHAEQRIGVPEALAASSRGRTVPRIGDAADLIALDSPADRLDPRSVSATLVGGAFTYRDL